MFYFEFHIIPEVIEAEFVIGSVGDVAVVGLLALGIIHIVLDNAYGQSQEFVDSTHPFRVSIGEVVVNGDDMDAFSCQGI